MLPEKLQAKIDKRRQSSTLRSLTLSKPDLIDFSSNDYLGFSKIQSVNHCSNAATGSRLLSGNHEIHERTEAAIASFHHTETALLFNSGYDANLGLIAAIAQRGDIILYDELVHASIRDGIQLSHAQDFKFKHNDTSHLRSLLEKYAINKTNAIYVITESVFSMDGDIAPLHELIEDIKGFSNVFLIVDEAHALGVLGKNGCGLVQGLHLENKVFARVMTFGKALGCHGAAVLGSSALKEYLINFSRPFIYSTALSPHATSVIYERYQLLENDEVANIRLKSVIQYFNLLLEEFGLRSRFRESVTAIQIAIIKGNFLVKQVATTLQSEGYDVRAILSPTVPEGSERLRICLHAYNTPEQCRGMVSLLTEILVSHE